MNASSNDCSGSNESSISIASSIDTSIISSSTTSKLIASITVISSISSNAISSIAVSTSSVISSSPGWSAQVDGVFCQQYSISSTTATVVATVDAVDEDVDAATVCVDVVISL